ncbi:MAG: RNA polymerase sigma factor [Nitrospiria bacterium]
MKEGGKEIEESVRRVQKGDTEAFEQIILYYEKPIFGLMCRVLGNDTDAEDTAQEVFIAAFRSIRKFRGESRFSTWLYRIAVNHALNRRKRISIEEKRQASAYFTPASIDGKDQEGDNDVLSRLPDTRPNPETRASQKETREQIEKGLRHLKADDALLILLHDLQEFPYGEVAQVLDIPLGTVKSRLHRARKALRKRLAPYFTEKVTR